MKLLLITQKVDVNDAVLGFFHRWIEEFAKQCEKVTVICLFKGEHTLPSNVKVLSLGKESGASRLTYIFRFYRYIFKERKNYDGVFVHMNQVYVILGAKTWWFLRKKIGLWYAHGHVPFSLRIAEKLVHHIFTSTKSGFRLDSKKVHIVGQGIDTDMFVPSQKRERRKTYKLVSVGRISPIKDYETLLSAMSILSSAGISVEVDIIGDAPTEEHERYLENLKVVVDKEGLGGVVNFLGAVPNKDILIHLQNSDLFINTSRTGSLDKAMLEAMSVGLLLLTCNEAMAEVLGDYKEILMYPKGDSRGLANKITSMLNLNEEKKEIVSKDMREIVVNNHDITSFVQRILAWY